MNRKLKAIFLLIVMIVCMALPARQANALFVPLEQAWYDDFNSMSIDTRWNVLGYNPSFLTLSEAPGFLRIKTQTGSWYSTDTTLDNVLNKSVSAEWYQVITKVTINPSENFQNASLFVFDDADNYIQIGRYIENGNQLLRFRREEGAAIQYSKSIPVTDTTIYLRIDKRASAYLGFYSTDGISWTFAGETFVALSNPKIGISANNGPGTNSINADFDFVSYTPNNTRPTVRVDENFDSAALHPRWQFLNEDPANWSLTSSSGSLQLIGQNSSLRGPGGSVTNLALTPAPKGRFIAKVLVDTAPTSNYQSGGLYVYENPDHYVRITRGYNDGQVISMRIEENGVFSTAYIPAPEEGPIWLSLIREGDTFYGSYSYDNATWNYVFHYTSHFEQAWFGLGAENAPSNSPIPVNFDAAQFRYDNWTEEPSPTTANLKSISMVSPVDGWIIGDDSTLLRYNGVGWQPVTFIPNFIFHAIDMHSANDGWLSGIDRTNNGYKPGIYHWDGISWNLMPNPPGMFVGASSIHAVGPNQAWFSMGYAACNPACSGDQGGAVYYWNGSAWSSYNMTTLHYGPRAIFMASPTDGWTVGYQYSSATGPKPSIFRWNGASWVNQGVQTIGSFLTGTASNTANAWVVGEGDIMKWDGASWSPVSWPGQEKLYSIDALSQNLAFAVGSAGRIIQWNGNAWNVMSSPTSADLNSVDMVSDREGWAVGSGGKILRYFVPPAALVLDYNSGQPGSYFTFYGENFVPGSSVNFKTNGFTFDETIPVDPTGSFSVLMSTTGAETGAYFSTVSGYSQVSAKFALESTADLHPQATSGTVLPLPVGIAYDQFLFLPLTRK